MRLIFCGTPDFAVPTLQRLAAEPDFRVTAVVTQPDRPRGRGLETSPSPVKQAALAAGLPVYQPGKLSTDEPYEFFRQAAPDAVVIIAFGQLIRQRLIEVPRLGWINLHASLLPKYRGAAPIQWAVVNGETKTGLTTMHIDAGMDTGPVLLQWETDIGPDETAPQLSARMAQAGPDLMVSTLRGLAGGSVQPRPQDNSQASLAPRLKREDGRIDWALPATAIYNRIRGLAPWPGAHTTFRQALCHVWGRPASPETAAALAPATPGDLLVDSGALFVACGQASWLLVDELQREGRKRIPAADFLSGARLQPGERFGTN